MSLRIRRGTDAQRTGKTFELGELVYTTDDQQLWVGDGVTAGGVAVVGATIAGYGLTFNNSTNRIEVSGITTDDVSQGINNKYFSTELAVDAVGAALVAGNLTNVGITFTYSQTQDDAGRINATVDPSAFVDLGLTDIVNDTTPQLGGSLDINSFNITGTGDVSIIGDITATGGTITADAYGTVNAKKLLLTDNTSSGIINAGLVLTTNVGPSNGDSWFSIKTHHNEASPAAVAANFTRSRGTSTAQTTLIDGDAIFALTFGGMTTDGEAVAGAIGCEVTGTPSDGILPGKFVIATVDDTGAFIPKLGIGPDGKQEIFAPALVAGASSGQVDTGTISSWMKVNFNGVDYAVPMYAIRP